MINIHFDQLCSHTILWKKSKNNLQFKCYLSIKVLIKLSWADLVRPEFKFFAYTFNSIVNDFKRVNKISWKLQIIYSINNLIFIHINMLMILFKLFWWSFKLYLKYSFDIYIFFSYYRPEPHLNHFFDYKIVLKFYNKYIHQLLILV